MNLKNTKDEVRINVWNTFADNKMEAITSYKSLNLWGIKC